MAGHAAEQNGAPPPSPPQGNAASVPKPPLPPGVPAERNAQRTISGPYRLTYTLTETDGDKKLGTQHYTLFLDADASYPWTTLKLGSKIPIDTAGPGPKSLPPLTQISYIDVGMNIEARLLQFANGIELRSHLVQSAVDSKQSALMTPIIRETNLVSAVLLTENKPAVLGDMLMPGSTHSLEVQVELSRPR